MPTADARLLAAATIFSAGTSGMTPQKAAEYVAQLEAALTPQNHTSGLVPVGWVRVALSEIDDKLYDHGSGSCHEAINKYQRELAQFSEPV